MTVGELRDLIKDVPDELLVGTDDADGIVCEIQFAGITSDYSTSQQYFLIHPNGGYPIFQD
jgi:hypothetical protein